MCPRSKAALSRRSRTAWGAADCISRASSPGAIIVSAHLAFAAGTAQAGKDAMPFPEALRALNHRDFRFFWGGQLVSLIGTWMQSVAQWWLVLQLSGSPLKLGLIGTFQFAPVLMFSVVAGAIVDRLPKRRLILATQSALALQAFTITALVWSGHVQYWHVAVLALLLGCANVIDMPTREVFVVEMVGKDDLVNAVALNSAAFNGARIVGPAVAGRLSGRLGVAPAFLLTGLSFLVVIGALLLVRAEGTPRPRTAATCRARSGALPGPPGSPSRPCAAGACPPRGRGAARRSPRGTRGRSAGTRGPRRGGRSGGRPPPGPRCVRR